MESRHADIIEMAEQGEETTSLLVIPDLERFFVQIQFFTIVVTI